MTRPSRLRNARGFTLIELMVTLAIIGVLASTAIAAYGRFSRKAREVEGEVAVRRVQTLETEFFTEYGLYSSDLLAIGFPDRPARKFYGLEITLGAGGGVFAYEAKATPNAGLPMELDSWFLTKFDDGSTELVHCFLAAGDASVPGEACQAGAAGAAGGKGGK